MDKKELINKIINKLKKFKKNKLIDIYNNYFNNFIKGGIPIRHETGRKLRNLNRRIIMNRKQSSAEQIATRRPTPPPTTRRSPPPPTTRRSPPPRAEPQSFPPPPRAEPQSFPTPPTTEPSRTDQRAFRQSPPRTDQRAFRSPPPRIQQQSQAIQYQSNQPKSGITTDFFQKDKIKFDKIKFHKLTTKFNEFEKNYKFHELYDKEITYQHTYDSFRIFTILKHMYRQRTHFQHLTDTLQIFQTLDKYYIKDLLIFVKNYFTKDAPKISFTYNIRNNKIYFKLNKLDGIMIYNMPFNTLDIRVKNENKTPLTQNIPIVDKKTETKTAVNEQEIKQLGKRGHSQ
jgi:hypothetical protein